MKKPKKLTKREKAFKAAVKKEMQEEGLLPPDKQRLNRKKFAKDTMAAFKEFNLYDAVWIYKAIYAMTPDGTSKWEHITPENVGVLKVIKAAIEWRRFDREKQEAGDTQYTIGELNEKVLSPIRKL